MTLCIHMPQHYVIINHVAEIFATLDAELLAISCWWWVRLIATINNIMYLICDMYMC